MAKGDVQVGKRRKPTTPAAVAARVAAFKDPVTHRPGVTLLNPGFFKLERMRAAVCVKARSARRKGLK